MYSTYAYIYSTVHNLTGVGFPLLSISRGKNLSRDPISFTAIEHWVVGGGGEEEGVGTHR